MQSPDRYESKSPEQTREIAAQLVRTLGPAAILALHGELGSGKTCFVQGLATALGIDHPVTSPTFTVVNEYRGSSSLVHIDMYRLSGPDDLFTIGFEDYLEARVFMAVEWAERAGDLMPPETVHIHFDTLPGRDRRSIRVSGTRNKETHDA